MLTAWLAGLWTENQLELWRAAAVTDKLETKKLITADNFMAQFIVCGLARRQKRPGLPVSTPPQWQQNNKLKTATFSFLPVCLPCLTTEAWFDLQLSLLLLGEKRENAQ